jgi:hypothetical protein
MVYILFTGGPSSIKIQEVPHMNKNSIPINVFLCFFMEVIQLLVAEAKYYGQFLDTLVSGGGHS